MILLLSGLALAAPCPDVDSLLDEAESAFDEAEVELSRTRLGAAYTALACQTRTVPRASLLELYHMDALASVAVEDRRAAVYAIIRAVTLDPAAMPPADVGPELLAQHEQWAARLRSDTVRVSVTDPMVDVWIDGGAVTSDEPVDVITGEHLVQVRADGAWTSRVVELIAGAAPAGLPLEVTRTPRDARPDGSGTPPVGGDPIGPALPPPPPGRRVHTGVAISGSALIVAGAGLAGGAYALEQRFHTDPYTDAEYDGCSRSDDCWEDKRADKIGADAQRTNVLYLSGYALMGLGAGMIGIDLLVASDGAGVRVRGRW